MAPKITEEIVTKIPVVKSGAAIERYTKILSDIDSLQNGDRIFSKESGQATYETLFNEFDLSANPIYNFFVDDELVNDKQGLGKRKLEDVPRYVIVSWERVPQVKPDSESSDQRSVTAKSTKPVLFGSEIDRKKTFDVDGMSFSPSHLQPESFNIIKQSLANDVLSSGMIAATLELDANNTGPSSGFSTQDVMTAFSEEAFLTDPTLAGISIQEFKAHIFDATLGINSTLNSLDSVQSQAKDSFVVNKFMFSRENGTVNIRSVSPSSPAISMGLQTANATTNSTDELSMISDRVMVRDAVIQDESTVTTKINFVNPNIAGAMSKSKVDLMTKPEHAESVIALSQVISQLDILSKTDFYDKKKGDIPSFKTPAGMPRLQYIGYVLEKYVKNKTGVFEKIEEIDFPNIEYDTYIDTKVLYGATYRYRIKTILRWTYETPSSLIGKKSNPSFQSSYFSSEWNEKWAYAMCIDEIPPSWPDEFNVRPESARKRVCVTFKIPDNSQRDLLSMTLYRKIKDARGNDLVSWSVVANTKASGLRNVLFFDYDVDFVQKNGLTYVYTAQSFSKHLESSDFSEQISCQLNSDYSIYGELPVQEISCAGVKPEYFGAFAIRPMRRDRFNVVVDEGAGQNMRLNVSGREVFAQSALVDSNYIVRFESLDNGEMFDIPVSTHYNNVPLIERTIPSGIWVPGAPVSHAADSEPFKSPIPQQAPNAPMRAIQKFLNDKSK